MYRFRLLGFGAMAARVVGLLLLVASVFRCRFFWCCETVTVRLLRALFVQGRAAMASPKATCVMVCAAAELLEIAT